MSKVTQTLVNRDFQKAVKTLRRILPKVSFGLLIGTYLISAAIMVIPHIQAQEATLLIIGSVLIHLAIQAGRGTLVFFFQLNPARYQSRFSLAVIAATLLLALSIWNAVIVFDDFGWSWIVPVNTLMLIGYIIEIMILRETMFATNMELYQNEEQWQELKEFYVAQQRFETFMEDISEGKFNVPNTNPAQPTPSPLTPELGADKNGFAVSGKLLEELKALGEEDIWKLLEGNGAANKRQLNGTAT